jgi:hypothetical protein
VWHGGRDLPLGGNPGALPPEPGSCRRAPRRQELNAVGYGGRYDARCTFLENFDSTIYFSKIMTN